MEIARSHPKFRAVWLPLNALCGLAGAATLLALPAVLGSAIDAMVGQSGAQRWLAAATGLIVISVIADLLGSYSSAAYTAAATRTIRRHLIDHLLNVTVARMPTGDLVSRVSGQAAEAAQTGLSRVTLVLSVLPPVGSLLALSLMDIRLAVAFLAGIGGVALVLRSFRRQTNAAAAAYQQAQGRIAGALTEALDGARTIAAAGTLERERERILRPLGELSAQGMRMWQVLARSTAQGAIAGPLVLIAVLAVSGILLSAGQLSAGELFSAGRYAAIGAGLGSLTGLLGSLARAGAARQRVSEVTALPRLSYGSTSLGDGDGTLVFQQVSVEGLMHDVELKLPGGVAVAVVGRSGSGKSLLAALAARLRDPDTGRVLLDGVPLPELDHDSLRAAIGCAFERPRLVGRTLSDSISPGVRETAEAVRAHDFIVRLPKGYDTPLAQAPMSGGELQRLGLARAWGASRVLVLDDAMSSLDMITEMGICESLFHDSSRTRLIVTHRVTTAERADLVAWLESGRVRALAPHALLWAEEEYRAVFR